MFQNDVPNDVKGVRLPAVAGQFYTADADQLRAQLAGFLAAAETAAKTATNADTNSDSGDQQRPLPKALIAPHAGYIYSGPVAATAYQTLKPIADRIERVVILSPAHRYGFRGIAWSAAEFFRTPLGDIPVDQDALASLDDLPYVMHLEQAFNGEHALEVHLPFLQTVLSDFHIVPLIVGMTPPEQVSAVLERLWGDEETLVVVSSDLSHFHTYDEARQRDRRTSKHIEQLDYQHIGGEDACGTYPLGGLLQLAQRHQLQAECLDLRNSGDTAGSRDSVVGYGAYVIHR